VVLVKGDEWKRKRSRKKSEDDSESQGKSTRWRAIDFELLVAAVPSGGVKSRSGMELVAGG